MARYQVALIEAPMDWKPESLDAVPPRLGSLLETIAEGDQLFESVRRAIAFNEGRERSANRWAVVVESGSLGCTWRNARLCTPLAYKVAAIWWPAGWEPRSPLDVPNCVWRAQGGTEDERLPYPQAVAVVQGLNQQAMNHGATLWYVVVAVENEPVSQTVSYDPAGTETAVQVRRLHVVRPIDGSGHGDCSHCPARSFDCAKGSTEIGDQMSESVERRVLQAQ